MALDRNTDAKILTAREMGLVGCRRCARVHPAGTPRCTDCGNRLSARDHMALQKVWAWWTVGLMAYVPANIFPMLRTHTFASDDASTIVGGAIELIEHGSVGVASIILIASVVIPISKFLAIAFLALSVRHGSTIPPGPRQIMYEIIEYIGRWSMIDVFVVAILAALVQLQNVATMSPGPASLFFALSVFFTMLSAQSFDSRAIWDANTPMKDKTT